jgi:isoleucyl-tRNA synthetase
MIDDESTSDATENLTAQNKSEIALREEQTLAFWNEHDIFKKSVERHAPLGEFVFYDGPPFATGLPHYGHIVTGIIKDAVPRYKTMRGYRVPRVWGWDCHGLPIENIVEKELGFKHKKDIKAYGIAKFNERCREQVLTYAHEWEKIIPRTGRWVDMKNAYRTMDKPYMESVWWVFKQLYDKGLVYEDYRSMHICTRCETTLSQQEVSEGYKDIKDIAVTVKFELVDEPGTFVLAWTTTPWTLPGNVALAVGNDIDYVKVPHKGLTSKVGELNVVRSNTAPPEYYVMSKDFLWKNVSSNAGHMEVVRDLFPDRDQLKEDVLANVSNFQSFAEKYGIEIFKGKDLVGKKYKPPFDYYVNNTTLKNRESGWKVYAADFVTTEAGTGIAHEAPAFGADDWELLKRFNLPFVQHVNFDGTMKPEVTDFAGMEVKPNAEDKVRLATDIAVLKYLQEHGLLFAKENIVHAYPHCWRCDTPLLNYATSSWFVNITQIKPALLETAQAVNWTPAHIKEGLFGKWLEGARDWSISRQRFWASVIPIWMCEKCKAHRVFGSVSELEEASGKKIDDLHKHIVDEVTIPCECGGEMKRIPDVLDTWFDSGSMPYGQVHYPFENKERFEKTFPAQFISEFTGQFRAWFYYLHALATALFSTNAFQQVVAHGIVLAEDGKKMSKRLQNYPDPMEVIDRYGADALRLYFLTSPVVQAENLNFSEKGVDEALKKNINRLGNVLAFYQLYADGTPRDWKSTNILDVWILSRLEELVQESTEGFESYRLDVAVRPITSFIDDLSVWYLRRSRDRFKTDGEDKTAALATLRYVLHTLSRVMAPSMPFFAEHLFQAIREEEDEESVHLAMWPEAEEATKNPDVLAAMKTARTIVTLALEAREKAGIKVRQPLNQLAVSSLQLTEDFKTIIAEELNVKGVIEKSGLDPNQIELDTELTDELKEEGLVRELVRAIQQYRKETGMKPGEPGTYAVLEKDKSIAEKYREQIEKATNTALELS